VSKYQPGQVWTYHTRPGEEGSRLTILKVEPYGKEGARSIHIQVTGLSIKNPQVASGISTEVGHLPFAEAAIEQSVVALVANNVSVDHLLEGYNTWKQEADKGKAGVFTGPVAEVIGF
jgi:hypothetical protein